MRTRYFTKTNGIRRKVTLKDFERLSKIQAKAIERAGNKVWTDRRGKQLKVSPERYSRLERKRDTAKKAVRLGWDLVSGTKRAARKGNKEGLRVREYPGPSMTIRSSVEEGIFHAMLLDSAKIAIREDGRMGFLAVTARVKSTVYTPGDMSGDTANEESVQLFAIKDQEVLRVDKETTVQALGRLTKGVEGLERKSPPKSDPSREVEAGKIVDSKKPVKESVGPRFADPGYFAEYESIIIIRGVSQ